MASLSDVLTRDDCRLGATGKSEGRPDFVKGFRSLDFARMTDQKTDRLRAESCRPAQASEEV